MPKHHGKQRIGLSIDPVVWGRCREKSKELGVNWSLVCEDAFVGVLAQLDKIQALVEASPNGASTAVIRSYLKAHVGDELSRSYKDIEEKFS